MLFKSLGRLKNGASHVWEAASPEYGERTKIRLQAIGLVISFLTLLIASYIGILQYRINESLLDLSYMPAIALTYDSVQHRLNIANQGKANLFLCGTQTSYDKGVSFDTPRLIAPGSFYQIRSDDLEKTVVQTIGKTGKTTISLEFYFQDAGEGRWKADNLLNVTVRDGTFSMETQTLAIVRVAWLRLGSVALIASSRAPGLERIKDLIYPLPVVPGLLLALLLGYVIRAKTKRTPPDTGPTAAHKTTR
jgi:hypothetical protein